MLKTTARVGIDPSSSLLLSIEFVSEQRSRDDNFFAVNDDNSLAILELFSDNAGKTTQHVTVTVNDNLLFEHA